MPHGEESKDASKEFLKPPFSAYDFFGYLIPAFVFFLCVFLFELAAKAFLPKAHTPLHGVFEYVTPAKEPLYQAALALGVVLVAYVCGHVIATISSALLDRGLIRQAHGYPSENLFVGKNLPLVIEAKQSVCRGAFAWANVFAWYLIVMIIFDVKGFVRYSVIAGALTVLFPLGLYLVCKEWIPKEKIGWPRDLIAGFARSYAAPYNFVWESLDMFFGWNETFSPRLSLQFRNAFKKQFGVEPKEAGTDLYWFSTFYISDKAPGLYQMLRNWFHLYSFARNVATAIYLAFCYGLLYIALLRWSGQAVNPDGKHCFLGILGAYFVLSFILAVRYHYLYHSYYSKNLIRLFVYLKIIEADAPLPPPDADEGEEAEDDITAA